MTRSAVEPGWQFWIDVGGTFTDCIAQAPFDGPSRGGNTRGGNTQGDSPHKRLHRLKLLSSAVTKLTAGHGSTRQRVITDRREPNDFWRNYRLRHLDADGGVLAEVIVAASFGEEGRLELATPLDRAPTPGDLFELISDEEAPILAIRRILELSLDQPIPAVSLRLGTTRGTNALLTRSGARTGLVTTVGLGDFLTIGNQDRPQLFELAIKKLVPLFAQTAEIHERISSDGRVLIEPVEAQIRESLESLRSAGITSLAICLLNAYRDDRHEALVERIARQMGFTEISRSCQVSPLIKMVSRGNTTVLDAYLNPVLRTYGGRLQSALGAGSVVRLLTSAGGLVDPKLF